jgi:MYXO-CTERM domain-containing protein
MNTGITNLQSNVFLAQTPEPSGLSLVGIALIPLLRRRRAR